MPVESKSDESGKAIRNALLRWYAANARTLPWRAPPGANARPEAYRVWLSEIMLQQTTVAAVKPFYERFTQRWPTLSDFANAAPEDVLSAWAGLGYYSRARNLIACAAAVMQDHGGRFPADEAALRALPGIGDYTAAAIAAIAFGKDAVPVDANVERVVARLFAITDPVPGARKAIRAAARSIWPGESLSGDFAQAMMDLGSSLCTSRVPACLTCPLTGHCAAQSLGMASDLPVKPARRVRPVRYGVAHWIERNGDVWLVRRPDKGMLGGMRALPGGEWLTAATPPHLMASALGTVRHIFTHFELNLSVIRGDAFADAVGEGEWWPIRRLDEAGLPTLYRRAAEIAVEERL